MNFNLIPDSLVNKFQQADDEAAVIDIISREKVSTKTIIECNPETVELDLYIIINDIDKEKFLEFINKKTDVDISKNTLASEKDYRLVLRIYEEGKSYIEFGIIECEATEDFINDDKIGYDMIVKIHSFDSEKAELIYLEDAEKIQIYNHLDKYFCIDCYDELTLAQYEL